MLRLEEMIACIDMISISWPAPPQPTATSGSKVARYISTKMAKRPLLQLPVAPSLPQFLKADEVTPSVDAVMHLSDYSEQKEGLSSKPSMLRRSRPGKCFCCEL